MSILSDLRMCIRFELMNFFDEYLIETVKDFKLMSCTKLLY